MDKDSIKEIIYKILSISQFDHNTQSYNILLDFATFFYNFALKRRYSNFKEYLKIKTFYTEIILFLLKNRDISHYF